MIDAAQLREMQKVHITEVDRSTLADIKNIHIDSALPAIQKMQSYFEQVGNPYCFRIGDTPIRVRFVSEEKTLTQSLFNYFSSLK